MLLAIALICLTATAIILVQIERAGTRRRRHAWDAYYDGSRRRHGSSTRRPAPVRLASR